MLSVILFSLLCLLCITAVAVKRCGKSGAAVASSAAPPAPSSGGQGQLESGAADDVRPQTERQSSTVGLISSVRAETQSILDDANHLAEDLNQIDFAVQKLSVATFEARKNSLVQSIKEYRTHCETARPQLIGRNCFEDVTVLDNLLVQINTLDKRFCLQPPAESMTVIEQFSELCQQTRNAATRVQDATANKSLRAQVLSRAANVLNAVTSCRTVGVSALNIPLCALLDNTIQYYNTIT